MKADWIPLVVADLYELAGAFRRRGEATARKAGQTQARWQVLSAASSGPQTVPQIARRLGIARQNVQRVVDELRTEGLVSLAPNPDHRRSRLIELTPAGQEVLARINAAARAGQLRISRKMRRRDLQDLRRGLRSLLEALRSEAPSVRE